jgi:3-oxoadipate enol-lactonase
MSQPCHGAGGEPMQPMGTSENFVEVDGGSLYYEITGEGLPLILIHGFTLDHRMWDDQLSALAQRHRVVRYDLRGFGRSSLPGAAYSHAHDLWALLAALGITRAALLGHSMGGGVAIDFALAYPDAILGLILEDSTLNGFAWSSETDAWFDAVDVAVRGGGVDAARASWLAHPFFLPAGEQAAVARRLYGIIGDYSGWHWTHADQQVSPVSSPPMLATITAPTLVIVGERDIPDFRAISDHLARRIPHAQEVVLPGVGHMANMESPGLFNQAVQRFLTEM